MIDDDKKKIYHCNDFYNENTKHFICKNNNIFNSISLNALEYHNYITLDQNMISNCQKSKKPDICPFSHKTYYYYK